MRSTTAICLRGRWFLAVAAILLAAALPLLGVVISGRSAADYLEFPPRTRFVQHAPFSWAAFVAIAIAGAGLLAFVLFYIRRDMRVAGAAGRAQKPFPAWGWAGVTAGAVAWVLAWTRFDWFAPFQRHTYTPLWLSYIVVVNALTYRNTGRSMLTHRPRYLALLFITSAAFWWSFEYLNRFVQNWHYTGIEFPGSVDYLVFGSISFSTVLPAVLGTRDWLDSMLAPLPPMSGRSLHPASAAVLLLLSAAALAGLGVWPNLLFPMLWIAPAIMVIALPRILGARGAYPLTVGLEPHRLARLALAALICGFFWEMWNWLSLAKWVYTIPYVDAFHVFEMPLLGYAGYLPFGVECGLAGAAVERMSLRRVASWE